MVLVALLLAGCTGTPSAPAAPGPRWRAGTLPAAGTVTLADLVACAGRWYAVGAVAGSDGVGRPATWESADGREWTSLTTVPATYYGTRHLLYAAACVGDRLGVLGAAPGGAHGNPRTGTWYLRGHALVEVPAPFEQYGGPRAAGVTRIGAGPAGFVIAGNRLDPGAGLGAAVWTSADGVTYRLVEDDPALVSTAALTTAAHDAVTGPGWWLAVGDRAPTRRGRTDRDPAAWTSRDGLHWSVLDVPATTEDETLDRVAPYGDGVLAVGTAGSAFAAWRGGPAGGWRRTGRFGSTAGDAVPRVCALAADGDRIFATVATGPGIGLWQTTDGVRWERVPVPVAEPARPDRTLLVAATAGGTMIGTADGRLWYAGG